MTIYPHELIGQRITVTAATNPQLVGVEGIVVDETQQTLTVQRDGKDITLLKRGLTLTLSTGEVLEGETLTKRPHDRIKGK